MPTVGMVVVDYRSGAETDRLLTMAAGGFDHAVVVDNGLDEAGLDEVCARHGATLVRPERNLGYGAGANLGVERLPAVEVIVVANPDVEVDGDGVRALAAAAHGAGLAGPRFRYPDGRPQPSAHDREPRLLTTLWDQSRLVGGLLSRLRPGWNPTLLPAGEHDRPRDVASVLGALVAVDAAAFAAVGGFDPGFFLYREETDLCRRLRLAGWRVRLEPGVVVVHALGASRAERPHATNPVHLASHYRYIAKHWGRPRAVAIRAAGAVAALTSVVLGPDRAAWWSSFRWHVTGRA